MIDSGLKSTQAVVDVSYIEADGDLKTIIVTQSFLFPDGSGDRPKVKVGKREECVRQWLELNGMLFLVFFLTCSHVTHRRRRGLLQVGKP